jgi:preprotein translocase subunit SecG
LPADSGRRGRFWKKPSVKQVLMQAALILVHLFVAIGLIIVVLLQRSEGGALGLGGSGAGLGGLFSPRGASDALTRTTMILGALFFLSSLALVLMSSGGRAVGPTLLDATAPKPAANQTAPATPSTVPTLPSANPAAPATPAAPAAPAAPTR